MYHFFDFKKKTIHAPLSPRYWGALANSTHLTGNLDAWFIDRDRSDIGHALWAVFGNATAAPGPQLQLGWRYIDPSVDFQVATNEGVAQAIVGERAWIAVVGEFRYDYVTWRAALRDD